MENFTIAGIIFQKQLEAIRQEEICASKAVVLCIEGRGVVHRRPHSNVLKPIICASKAAFKCTKKVICASKAAFKCTKNSHLRSLEGHNHENKNLSTNPKMRSNELRKVFSAAESCNHENQNLSTNPKMRSNELRKNDFFQKCVQMN